MGEMKNMAYWKARMDASPLRQEQKVDSGEGVFSPPDDSGDWKRVSGTRIWEKKKTEGLHDKITARPADKMGRRVTAQKTTKKNSEFDKAFASARKAGQKEFTYKGKKYHTKLKT
tara:strand:+ start:14 stop:358 length:345 start_codon:yes stop_codon:yes gene_type:complete